MEARGWRTLCLLASLSSCGWDAVRGQLRYSVPEELAHGAFVGNIAEDLGLNLDTLSARRFRIVSGAKKQYVEVNLENGVLFVNERMDREELCEQSLSCSFHLQVVIENPLELYRVEVEISDVNDNSPTFPWTEYNLDISESAATGSRFPLESAQDLDVASNALRTYLLSVNEHFQLDVQTRSDGTKFAELVLRSPLDREQRGAHQVVLTAVDGGTPERSGTVQIDVTVLDANDNAPVFERSFYRVRLPENPPRGAVVIRLNASDLDEGANADVTYAFSGHAAAKVRQLFSVDPRTGEIKVKGVIDYEKARMHEIYVQAKDKGPSAVAVHCKVLVNVLDTNDNAPEVILTSVSTPVQEDAPPGTVIAVISVLDQDSGENGDVDCEIPEQVPFQLHSTFKNYYTLVTSDLLDRETVAEYNITLTARDGGSPPLFTRKTILVQVSDVNDNAPRFTQPAYTVYLAENNAPGASICSVSALDPDSGQNAYISYSILRGDILGTPLSAYVSVNSDSGNIYALRSFDHEQLQKFQITVQAQDAGFPPLRSNVSVRVFVVDQNDNAPVVVAPVARNGTAAPGAVPRSVDVGYLVTKISAVDADEGQNARLCYEVLQATQPSLFGVALYTGEVRTARPLTETDARRHTLVIVVKDNGQPALSATVSITLSVVDSLPAPMRPNLDELSLSAHSSPTLRLCVIVTLGAVSTTFLLAIIVLVAARRLKASATSGGASSRFSSLSCCCCCAPASRTPGTAVGAPGGCAESSGALPQVYCYNMCLTPDSSKSDFMFLKPCSPVMSVHQNNLSPGWTSLERNNTAAAPAEFKSSNQDRTWTKNQCNSALDQRFSYGNTDGTHSHQSKYEDDGFSCPTPPQYWTLGSRSKDYKLSLEEETGSHCSWTPASAAASAAADHQHNVYIPGSWLKPTPRGDLHVYNTFSTFGKKKNFTSAYEHREHGLISPANFSPVKPQPFSN